MEKIIYEEKCYWQKVKQVLISRKQQIQVTMANTTKDSSDFQKYLYENKGTIDPHEMFTNQRLLTQKQLSEGILLQQQQKIERFLKDPYFSRIDFQFSGEDRDVPIYIGKASFTNDQEEFLIYDWRAPISSLFYEYDVGKASYDSPQGVIAGIITNKRQLKFKQGELIQVFDSAGNVYDKVLQEVLSQQRGGQMTTIVSSIQKEQNQIIRMDQSTDLIIQGVAGSGKTTIALHRIAFLLYKYREKIKSENVWILSPNRVFSHYIAEVLPELGEKPVYEITDEQLAEHILGAASSFQSKHDENEKILLERDAAYLKRVAYKQSQKLVDDLEIFLKTIDQTAFSPSKIQIDNYHYSKEYLTKRYFAYIKRPVVERFKQIAADILDDLQTKPFYRKKITLLQLQKTILKQFHFSTPLAIYNDFLKTGPFRDDKCRYEYSDLFPLIRIHFYFEKLKGFETIQYLIIDEMQDYSPIQYKVFQLLFPGSKLLLGDFTQRVTSLNETNLDALQTWFPRSRLLKLKKSYRSTFEILMFAKSLIGDQEIQPIDRHGNPVQVHMTKNGAEEAAKVMEILEKNSNVTFITKTNEEAQKWNQLLTKKITGKIQLLTGKSDRIEEGLVISLVAFAKGLEFETVIVLDADSMKNPTLQKRLLFIACTRALHQLYLIKRE